jgi:hypothetical protein
MIRAVAAVLLVPLLVSTGGCRALAMILPEPMKTVSAEYPYLADKRVCIVVRAPEEMAFEYANIQWEVADHVRVALEGNVHGVTVVDPKKIVDFQRGESNWESMDPARLGQHFDTDRLIEIELTQYATREPESPHLFRGHIWAAVRVYNTEYPNSQPAYKTDIRTAYPPDGPGQYGTNDRAIRGATMDAFGQDVAAKFYDRQVKVK